MPTYAYRCRTCDDGFEIRRLMSESVVGAVTCSRGHEDTTRVFSAVAVGGRAAPIGSAAPSAPSAGGGCCGGGCCG